MSLRNIIKPFLGYLWVLLIVPVTAVLFVNIDFFEQKLIVDQGVHASERWKGGSVEEIKQYKGYNTIIHKTVFQGLFAERSDGFIQIDWEADTSLPKMIEEEIDYNKDGKTDFYLKLNTLKNVVELKAFSDKVGCVSKEGVLVYDKSRTVRVILKK